MTCKFCDGRGTCQPCRGCGRSGYFLVKPPNTAKTCPWCHGAGCCRNCGGTGETKSPEEAFEPTIHVLTSLQTPTSITVAAFTGAPWRTIRIPRSVLQRSFAAQRGWVSWRAKRHFKDNGGQCRLFGDILGYIWRYSLTESARFDVRGNVTGENGTSIGSSAGWLSFRGKKIKLGNSSMNC